MGKMEEGNGKGQVREGRKLPLAIPRRIDPRYTVFAKLLAWCDGIQRSSIAVVQELGGIWPAKQLVYSRVANDGHMRPADSLEAG